MQHCSEARSIVHASALQRIECGSCFMSVSHLICAPHDAYRCCRSRRPARRQWRCRRRRERARCWWTPPLAASSGSSPAVRPYLALPLAAPSSRDFVMRVHVSVSAGWLRACILQTIDSADDRCSCAACADDACLLRTALRASLMTSIVLLQGRARQGRAPSRSSRASSASPCCRRGARVFVSQLKADMSCRVPAADRAQLHV